MSCTTFAPTPPEHLRAASEPEYAVEWWLNRLEKRPMFPKPLFVYVIQDSSGAVKIGKANNPVARLSELQCGNPYPLTLRAVVVAYYGTEETLHYLWARYRVRGEWFGSGLAGEGKPDRYHKVGGYVRIQPADHPSVQDAIVRLALDAQREQVVAAVGGASEGEIVGIADSLIRPPAEWPEVKAAA